MSKNIWVLHHYADPPNGHWTGTYDLYKHLVQKGHRITIFSSSFSHYTLREERLKPHQHYKEEYFGGVRFIFIRTVPYFNNDHRRILNMLSYAIKAYWIGSCKKDAPDIIVGSTPHPFCALTALLLARRKRARFFLEVHDLWLEYLLDTHKLSPKSLFVAALIWIDKFCYNEAEKVLTLWSRMGRYLEQLGVPPGKIAWMPLGVDLDEPEISDNNPRLSSVPFAAMCAGRFGNEGNAKDILEAAKVLQDNGEDRIRFIFVGGGPGKDDLVRSARESGQRNVEFRDMVPKTEIRRHLAEADICIGSLPDVPCYNKYGIIPTKLIEYLAMRRPVVYITGDEDSLVKRAGAGFVVSPGDPQALAQAIVKVAGMELSERARMGENGLKYLKENHDLKVLAERLEALLC